MLPGCVNTVANYGTCCPGEPISQACQEDHPGVGGWAVSCAPACALHTQSQDRVQSGKHWHWTEEDIADIKPQGCHSGGKV